MKDRALGTKSSTFPVGSFDWCLKTTQRCFPCMISLLLFIIDEDMPRSLATVLKKEGYEVIDIRDVGLRNQRDVLFGRLYKYKPGSVHYRVF